MNKKMFIIYLFLPLFCFFVFPFNSYGKELKSFTCEYKLVSNPWVTGVTGQRGAATSVSGDNSILNGTLPFYYKNSETFSINFTKIKDTQWKATLDIGDNIFKGGASGWDYQDEPMIDHAGSDNLNPTSETTIYISQSRINSEQELCPTEIYLYNYCANGFRFYDTVNDIWVDSIKGGSNDTCWISSVPYFVFAYSYDTAPSFPDITAFVKNNSTQFYHFLYKEYEYKGNDAWKNGYVEVGRYGMGSEYYQWNIPDDKLAEYKNYIAHQVLTETWENSSGTTTKYVDISLKNKEYEIPETPKRTERQCCADYYEAQKEYEIATATGFNYAGLKQLSDNINYIREECSPLFGYNDDEEFIGECRTVNVSFVKLPEFGTPKNANFKYAENIPSAYLEKNSENISTIASHFYLNNYIDTNKETISGLYTEYESGTTDYIYSNPISNVNFFGKFDTDTIPIYIGISEKTENPPIDDPDDPVVPGRTGNTNSNTGQILSKDCMYYGKNTTNNTEGWVSFYEGYIWSYTRFADDSVSSDLINSYNVVSNDTSTLNTSGSDGQWTAVRGTDFADNYYIFSEQMGQLVEEYANEYLSDNKTLFGHCEENEKTSRAIAWCKVKLAASLENSSGINNFCSNFYAKEKGRRSLLEFLTQCVWFETDALTGMKASKKVATGNACVVATDYAANSITEAKLKTELERLGINLGDTILPGSYDISNSSKYDFIDIKINDSNSNRLDARVYSNWAPEKFYGCQIVDANPENETMFSIMTGSTDHEGTFDNFFMLFENKEDYESICKNKRNSDSYMSDGKAMLNFEFSNRQDAYTYRVTQDVELTCSFRQQFFNDNFVDSGIEDITNFIGAYPSGGDRAEFRVIFGKDGKITVHNDQNVEKIGIKFLYDTFDLQNIYSITQKTNVENIGLDFTIYTTDLSKIKDKAEQVATGVWIAAGITFGATAIYGLIVKRPDKMIAGAIKAMKKAAVGLAIIAAGEYVIRYFYSFTNRNDRTVILTNYMGLSKTELKALSDGVGMINNIRLFDAVKLGESNGNTNNFKCTIAPYKKPDSPIIDDPIEDSCSFFGENSQVEKILKYIMNIIRIVAISLLIIFGVLDFTKSLASSDSDALLKSGRSFIKRLIIAILVFFIPAVITLLFDIINKDSCVNNF